VFTKGLTIFVPVTGVTLSYDIEIIMNIGGSARKMEDERSSDEFNGNNPGNQSHLTTFAHLSSQHAAWPHFGAFPARKS
jgi:hypothetical protein